MATSLLLSATSLTLSLSKLQNPRKTLIPNSTLSLSTSYPNFLNFTLNSTPKPLQFRRRLLAGTSFGDSDENPDELIVGEYSEAFQLGAQKLSFWVYFGLILGVVLFALNYLWIDNSTGFGKDFITAVESISVNSLWIDNSTGFGKDCTSGE